MYRLNHYMLVLLQGLAGAAYVEASVLLAVDEVIQAESEVDARTLSEAADTNGRYVFDESLFKGTSLEGIDITRLNSTGLILPGTYRVDVVVDKNILSRLDVEFISETVDSTVEPCLSEFFLVDVVGVKSSYFEGQLSDKCQSLSEVMPEARFDFDSANLMLTLIIPQAFLDQRAPDYVAPSLLEVGETMLFTNYDASGYESNSDSLTSRYGYVSLESGINIGMWRFRNLSNFNYTDYADRSATHWNNVRTYAQRAIPSIGSELTVGDNYTSSNLFGGLSYRGISLATDERMRPSSQVGYAPEVRGVAATTARVIIKQAGKIVKEVTVAPGPFVINDLSSFSQAGDLDVEVVEANGAVSTFVVPYAAVPESMRPGMFRYSIDVGQVSSYGFDDDYFADVTYQVGLSNALTANAGVRLAEDYYALLGGAVFASEYGAFGLTTTYSSAKLNYGVREQGWRLGLNYSKTFDPTGTSVGLAGYRYSSQGFRDLIDVLGERDDSGISQGWSSATLLQRNQVTISVNQSLADFGNLYISGSVSDYYDGRSSNTQLQAGYSNSWRGLSYSLTWSRQNYFYFVDYLDLSDSPNYYSSNKGMTNIITASVSMPLGGSRYAPYLSSMVSKTYGDDSRATYQTSVSGALETEQPVSYSVSAAYEDPSRQSSYSGNLSANMPYANLAANYSRGSDYEQYGGSVSGSVVAHTGGITLGPRLTDTFALVEAKGAQGARVRGFSGARVDRFGYALVTGLSPYRFNSIGIDPADMEFDTELLETEIRVAPYAGSSLKVDFETLKGYPLLISATRISGGPIPLGASVYNKSNLEVGMVGQGGQLYARAEEMEGVFFVRWGEDLAEGCVINYLLDNDILMSAEIIRLDLPCTDVDGSNL